MTMMHNKPTKKQDTCIKAASTKNNNCPARAPLMHAIAANSVAHAANSIAARARTRDFAPWA